MNKKIQLLVFAVVLLAVGYGVYLLLTYSHQSVPSNQEPIATSSIPVSNNSEITYLISQEDPAKYCNGADMDSTGYQQTISVPVSTSLSSINQKKIEIIKTVISAATTGMCKTALNQLDITENAGIVYIPPIDAWAGVSITMCSCKPQVEVNLLRIPGISQVIWSASASNFTECVAMGQPVMESYPRQCRYGDKIFAEDIGNELSKDSLINLTSPRPNEEVASPLVIKGQARGSWFFEASFPVFLVDWDGRIIAEGIAQAKSDWMTDDFVPFEATLTFSVDKEAYSNRAALILKKDNPSGLSQNDDALEIPLLLAY